MTKEQMNALRDISERYNVSFQPEQFKPAFDLPDGYVAGWVGPIYIGIAPDGVISS